MPPTLASTWAVKATAGEPVAIVRVRNLQSVARIGADAWGRAGKPQPVLISAEVSLARPFAESSSTDKVETDTVHYGLLSKAILATLDEVDAASVAGGAVVSLRRLLDTIWWKLTSLGVDGSPAPGAVDDTKAFLNLAAVRYLSVTIHLPKATLSGAGVSLTGISIFTAGALGPEVDLYGLRLQLHRIQVPILVGINSNEREAKQLVVADVKIDNFVETTDIHPLLEKAIYDSMSNSSFGTLEALAVDLTAALNTSRGQVPAEVPSAAEWRINIQLEKPVAVPLAEGAGIEFLASAASL
ncbi:unnamed protein product [Parascedosporium putredinis]|uniref:Dihydroneopterin aldolase/epimerase domain-containing protein n=1 Tax=Parascedosporium putredinis TaxID=1442378 RepID=A0A9P1H6G2_9PEZI|nr:unnamed protein product [Parascedosporium putredinis]CAI7997993.1 unnamed protein product [Parascedosporium putredinis]